MYLAHAVDGAHEQLVEMAADEEEARLVEDQLDDTPDLLDEGRRQEEPHAHVLDALRPNVEALFDELLEGRLGTRRRRGGRRAGGGALDVGVGAREGGVVLRHEGMERRALLPRQALNDARLDVGKVRLEVGGQPRLVLDERFDHLAEVKRLQPKVGEGAARGGEEMSAWLGAGHAGRCGEMWGAVGRCGEMWGDAERCGAIYGDTVEMSHLELEMVEDCWEGHRRCRVRCEDGLETAREEGGVEGLVGEERREVALAEAALLRLEEGEEHLKVELLAEGELLRHVDANLRGGQHAGHPSAQPCDARDDGVAWGGGARVEVASEARGVCLGLDRVPQPADRLELGRHRRLRHGIPPVPLYRVGLTKRGEQTVARGRTAGRGAAGGRVDGARARGGRVRRRAARRRRGGGKVRRT